MAIKNKSDLQESFLVFSVQNSTYAIYSSSVIELIWLPELSRIESQSFYVVGYFNFRGEFLPIIDLNLRQGMKTKRYTIQDKILVITNGTSKFGIHINDVFNVIHFSFEKDNVANEVIPNKITDGVIQTQFGITQILNIESLANLNIPQGETFKFKEFSEAHLAKLFSGMSDVDRQVLINRRNSYSQSAKIKEYSKLLSVVVLRLKDEYLAVELKYILEFAHGDGITKIPCVPDHISGCINLRGDMLVLIDFLYLLKAEKNENFENKKVIVVRYNDMMLGLLVDQLIDVIYLSKEQILINPPNKNANGQDLMKGVCFHDSQMVGLVDIEKIYTYEKLYVEENVSY